MSWQECGPLVSWSYWHVGAGVGCVGAAVGLVGARVGAVGAGVGAVGAGVGAVGEGVGAVELGALVKLFNHWSIVYVTLVYSSLK